MNITARPVATPSIIVTVADIDITLTLDEADALRDAISEAMHAAVEAETEAVSAACTRAVESERAYMRARIPPPPAPAAEVQ